MLSDLTSRDYSLSLFGILHCYSYITSFVSGHESQKCSIVGGTKAITIFGGGRERNLIIPFSLASGSNQIVSGGRKLNRHLSAIKIWICSSWHAFLKITKSLTISLVFPPTLPLIVNDNQCKLGFILFGASLFAHDFATTGNRINMTPTMWGR